MWLTKKFVLGLIYYISILYFTYLMVLITLQYIPISFDVAFLRIKQDEIKLDYYKWAFFIHVYSSIFVLIAGITQFSTIVRRKMRQVHRQLGKTYILLVLFLASPSGLIMALHANGGIPSIIAFSIMAVLWFYFTYKAYQFAKGKKWVKHENFMLRSYALTLSAISLRLFKWILAHLFELPPMDMYRIIAWAGWLVNIILIEIYIYNKDKRNK